jgi:hypothetical protein
MIERLFCSAFLTACLWSIAHFSPLPQSSSPMFGQLSSTDHWFQIEVSGLDRQIR